MSEDTFHAELTRGEGFHFEVDFGNPEWAKILVDEPPPLGEGTGPAASHLLAAAVGNCLAASLLFCAEKARVPLAGLRARVEGVRERNEQGRFRIRSLRVVLHPTLEGGASPRFDRCLDVFEEFCVVTQSVRSGIDVQVEVATEGEVAGAPREAPEEG